MTKLFRRKNVENGVIMFISMNTWNRAQIFLHERFAKAAIQQLYPIVERGEMTLYGFVVMPDHLHLLLKVHPPYRVSVLMHEYRTALSFEVNAGAFLDEYYDLRMPEKPETKLEYMYEKPVKAGRAKS